MITDFVQMTCGTSTVAPLVKTWLWKGSGRTRSLLKSKRGGRLSDILFSFSGIHKFPWICVPCSHFYYNGTIVACWINKNYLSLVLVLMAL